MPLTPGSTAAADHQPYTGQLLLKSHLAWGCLYLIKISSFKMAPFQKTYANVKCATLEVHKNGFIEKIFAISVK
jgi:hypothetical protein